MQKEMEKYYKVVELPFQVDILTVNNIVKDNYEDPYPKQQFDPPTDY